MEQRERIIEAAAKMFAEQGIKSIRMDDIAHALAISKRTLYEMFADKEELLYLSVRHLQRKRMAAVQAALCNHSDDLSYIFEGMREMLKNRERHSRISNNLRKFYPETFERVRQEVTEESGKILYSLISGYVEHGLILPTVDVRLSVTILYYTTTSLTSMAGNMSLPDGVSFDDAMSYTIVNFFRGLATLKGLQQIDDYFKRKAEQTKIIE